MSNQFIPPIPQAVYPHHVPTPPAPHHGHPTSSGAPPPSQPPVLPVNSASPGPTMPRPGINTVNSNPGMTNGNNGYQQHQQQQPPPNSYGYNFNAPPFQHNGYNPNFMPYSPSPIPQSYMPPNVNYHQPSYQQTPGRPIIVSSTPMSSAAPPFIPHHYARNMYDQIPPHLPYGQMPQMHPGSPMMPPPQMLHEMQSPGMYHFRPYNENMPPPTPPPYVDQQMDQHVPMVQAVAQPAELASASPDVDVAKPVAVDAPLSPPVAIAALVKKAVFRPPLPWYSAPGHSFPPRARRRAKKSSNDVFTPKQDIPPSTPKAEIKETEKVLEQKAVEMPPQKDNSTEVHLDHVDTASSSNAGTSTPPLSNGNVLPSDFEMSTQRTTPSPISKIASLARPKVVVPNVPVIPIYPKQGNHTPKPSLSNTENKSDTMLKMDAKDTAPKTTNGDTKEDKVKEEESTEIATSLVAPVALKSWADLVRTKAAPIAQTPVQVSAEVTQTNGVKTKSLSEVLKGYQVVVEKDSKGAWIGSMLEPRGLINTGNMCFMNAILQMLVFCQPFYSLLDIVGKNVAHNFKSNTPLMDAMILFMREFRPLDALTNTKKSALGGEEPGLAGQPFVPEFLYEALKGLPQISTMRRGQQQDAEEFLGFLLDGLHEEAVLTIKTSAENSTNGTPGAKPDTTTPSLAGGEDSSGWLEVGHKQKTATTRNVGHIAGVSPITTIFGGTLRSELRKQGQKNSVTREPFLPLQLDISATEINNIIDALRHLNTLETFPADPNSQAPAITKQISIDSLPPVLIIHLKRFHYNSTGGTQKIWKKIGYPAELEIPKEALSPNQRDTKPEKYKLVGVVYHHGKSALGGHYTVDIRRQDGWIRMDDTVVKRVLENDVIVDMGPARKTGGKKGDHDDEDWEQVNGSGGSKSATNGSYANVGKGNKEDKVAYLLFFQKL